MPEQVQRGLLLRASQVLTQLLAALGPDDPLRLPVQAALDAVQDRLAAQQVD